MLTVKDMAVEWILDRWASLKCSLFVSGVVTLISDYKVCKEGAPLTAEQARLLRYLDCKMSTFEVDLVAHWSKESGFKLIRW